MAQFKGDSRDAKRARQGARVQEEMKEAFERKIQQMRQETEAAVQNMELNQMFSYEEGLGDKKFKDSIVGLQSHDEYKNKLDTYLEQHAYNDMDEDYQCNEPVERNSSNNKNGDNATEDNQPISNTSYRLKQLEKQLLYKKNKGTKRKRADPTLSFEFEEGTDTPLSKTQDTSTLASVSSSSSMTSTGGGVGVVPKDNSTAASHLNEAPSEEAINEITTMPSKRRKISKNPDVDTSFLPDAERDAADARLRMELEKEWNELQKKVKRERLEITYSYWDGSGHRRSIEIVKGMKVGEFLELCRKELAQHFSELRGISGEHLMYIKDDLIIPHSYAFYDLIIASGRGKSGNYMFKNESYDKGEYHIERDGGHPGKIITRAWYDRNKHIFPASRWEVYDPTLQEENK